MISHLDCETLDPGMVDLGIDKSCNCWLETWYVLDLAQLSIHHCQLCNNPYTWPWYAPWYGG